MWVYNVVRELYSSVGITPWPETVPPRVDELLAKVATTDPGTGRIWCIKTHNKIRAHADGIRVICPYRDVRDAMMSYMRFLGSTFEKALEIAEYMMQISDWYLQEETANVHAIPYDDIVDRAVETITSISGFLGLTVEPENIVDIAEHLSKEKVASRIALLEQKSANRNDSEGQACISLRNMDGNYRVYDSKTGFQGGHIGSSPDGAWRTELSSDQRERLCRLTADWVKRYGFGK